MNRFSDRLISFLISGTIIVIILTAFKSGGTGRPGNTLFPKKISVENLPVQSGDLIFRNGKGMISNAFRLTAQKKAWYSHAGIIHCEGGKIFVIHVIDGGTVPSKIRKESLKSFCDRNECYSFGIYRTELKGKEIDQNAVKALSELITFDKHFDLSTDNQMYCTEFVYKTLKKTSGSFFIPLSTVSGQPYVACDDLFLAKGNSVIYTHTY